MPWTGWADGMGGDEESFGEGWMLELEGANGRGGMATWGLAVVRRSLGRFWPAQLLQP